MLRGPKLYPTAADRFITEHTGIRSQRSAEKFRWVLKNLQARYPDLRVDEFTERHLVEWLTFTDAGDPRLETTAPATIVGYRTPLISFFGWASYAGLVETNPAEHLKRIVNPRVENVRSHTWLSEDQLEELLATGPADDLIARRDRVTLALGVFSGLRVHELCGLRWGAVNLKGRCLDVLGKGRKRANQPIPPNLVEELTSWATLWVREAGQMPQADEAVVVGLRSTWVSQLECARQPQWGKPVSRQVVSRIVREHGERIGVRDLRPHDLRRSYAGLLENRGLDLREIRQLLRHSNTGTTERYLADNPARVADSLTAALGGLRIGGA